MLIDSVISAVRTLMTSTCSKAKTYSGGGIIILSKNSGRQLVINYRCLLYTLKHNICVRSLIKILILFKNHFVCRKT